MKRLVAAVLITVIGCQSQSPPSDVLTDAQRSAITGEIRAILDTIHAAAREIRTEPLTQAMSAEDGICLWQTKIYSCSEVLKGYAEAWAPANPNRPRRQEMDSIDVRIQVLSPDFAVAAQTIKENRFVAADGKVSRASFANFVIFHREAGRWKQHSGQQAAWPLDSVAQQ